MYITHTVYTLQSPQNESENLYHHKHEFWCVYSMSRLYKHGLFE